ncbi:hypothetical protein ABEB36_010072 [Hypothenemus hampei]|uniref:Uncharacterized protein n=1 Tax=Hypothenemus hampei TaxID=57062 RepID=A0ABD1EIW6_HYPHA
MDSRSQFMMRNTVQIRAPIKISNIQKSSFIPSESQEQFFDRDNTNSTPTPLQKVNSWMKNLENRFCLDFDDLIESKCLNENPAGRLDNNVIRGEDEKSIGKWSTSSKRFEVTPSEGSPENEKKNELCSYLQLMKPTDKKAIMDLQNRRSARVKNLSFKDKQKSDEPGKSNGEQTKMFKFPMPSEKLNAISDFENAIYIQELNAHSVDTTMSLTENLPVERPATRSNQKTDDTHNKKDKSLKKKKKKEKFNSLFKIRLLNKKKKNSKPAKNNKKRLNVSQLKIQRSPTKLNERSSYEDQSTSIDKSKIQYSLLNEEQQSCIEKPNDFLNSKPKYFAQIINVESPKCLQLELLHKIHEDAFAQQNQTIPSKDRIHRGFSVSTPSFKSFKNEKHLITVPKEHGPVVKAFYVNHNLVLCQNSLVSIWTQSALDHVLGSHNMWISRGTVNRMLMPSKNCTFKESIDTVTASEVGVSYVELWIKEHESDIREAPVADVFAVVYFWRKGQNGLDKKVLQLENIKGFADAVQFSVFKTTPKIIVSWYLDSTELEKKKTFVHCYELASNFELISHVNKFEDVEHFVSSLHNIEGSDTLIMGCGENKITLWDVDRGRVVVTIEMSKIRLPLSTLWVYCHMGYLFVLQQCVDRELRLIAINGMNHSWTKLASYVSPEEYDSLRGACVEEGIVWASYNKGIICWNASTAEVVLKTEQLESGYISNKYIVNVQDEQVYLRRALMHLLFDIC